VKAVVTEYETSEGRAAVQEALRKRFAGAKPGDAVQRSLENLREVPAILAAKAPGDAPAFKAWLSSISQKVAEASSEGGFLGIGGVQVARSSDGVRAAQIRVISSRMRQSQGGRADRFAVPELVERGFKSVGSGFPGYPLMALSGPDCRSRECPAKRHKAGLVGLGPQCPPMTQHTSFLSRAISCLDLARR